MLKLNSKHLYDNHPVRYEVLSDYVFTKQREVPILNTTPEALLEVEPEDCYLDEEGNFFVPNFYNWTYKGSDDITDPDEYAPVYDPSTPALTKLEVANLVALVEDLDLNNPANNL